MEYLDGCTLSDVLAEEDRLPLYWVVDILEQVCCAVHEAHQQGIVHRDLKPDNIWLEPNGLGGYRVKVLDFGIAKMAEGAAAGVSLDESAELPQAIPPTMSALEASTMIHPAAPAESDESATIMLPSAQDQTRMFDSPRHTAGGMRATAVPG